MDSQEEVEWCDKEKRNVNDVRFSLVDFVKEGQHFISKTLLKAAFEICAMKHNFDYKLVKSDKKCGTFVAQMMIAVGVFVQRAYLVHLILSSKSMYLIIRVLHPKGRVLFGQLQQKQLVL
ncbi:hypothetical protein F2Q68_00038399 [Brassica cretica]|uniref:Uncharacterized protein n=1 Tax=Brassica cretica TaxID=69181 RepID=A0A8S9MS80_BRACR|nr:hypothetical protein F2Q68_00038399 [Brassica cretica]